MFKESIIMSIRSSFLIASVAFPSMALASITPGSLVGDSYIVRASGRDYSVLDIYIKGDSASDIISSVFGAAAHTAAFRMVQGDAFVHGAGSSNDAWKPDASATAWDSFLTAGARDQAAAASLQLGLDANWAAGNGSAITGVGSGAGWYPAVGANTSTNPYARVGLYNGQTGAVNTAKADRLIAGNGITVGQNLDNHWMLGRFTIDVTGLDAAAVRTMNLRFAIAGKQNGTTVFSGGSSAAGRFDAVLSFAVPSPGAAALVSLAGMLTRRRRVA